MKKPKGDYSTGKKSVTNAKTNKAKGKRYGK
jgi:hypothetical protein